MAHLSTGQYDPPGDFSRSIIDFENVYKSFQDLGVDLISTQENFDTSTYGSGKAGDIQAQYHYKGSGEGLRDGKDALFISYIIHTNSNHDPNVQFATIAHELAHLFLGHLGSNKELKVHSRRGLSHAQIELEAESASYLICKRAGVDSESEAYLSEFVREHELVESLDLYMVMKAAGQVESLLELVGERMQFDKR